MALRSASERLNLVMNGNNIDDHQYYNYYSNNDKIIEKEILAYENAYELNDLYNTILKSNSVLELAEQSFNNNLSVLDILENYGLSKISLKVLSTNKLYTDIWKLELPSVESLDSVGSNKSYANSAIEAISDKLGKVWNGIRKGAEWLKNKIIEYWNKFMARLKSGGEKIKSLFGRAKQNTNQPNKSDSTNNTKESDIQVPSIEALNALDEKAIECENVIAEAITEINNAKTSEEINNVISEKIEPLKKIKDTNKFGLTTSGRSAASKILQYIKLVDKNIKNSQKGKTNADKIIKSLDDILKSSPMKDTGSGYKKANSKEERKQRRKDAIEINSFSPDAKNYQERLVRDKLAALRKVEIANLVPSRLRQEMNKHSYRVAKAIADNPELAFTVN